MKRLGNNAIEVGTLKLELDRDTAWALCNILCSDHIVKECKGQLDKSQHDGLIELGAAIGAFIDHPNSFFSSRLKPRKKQSKDES